MSGIIALSIDENVYGSGKTKEVVNTEFASDLFWTTFYHQHLGPEYGGLATLSEKKDELILLRTHRGLFRPQFQDDLNGFMAPLGIGHISAGLREPYLVLESSFPPFAICFSGNIINREELIVSLKSEGHILERKDDVVLISNLLAKAGWDNKKTDDENFAEGIRHMIKQLKGSCALAILTKKKIYAVRGPDGHEPLILAKKKGAVVVVSESCSLYNQGFKFERELDPGEIISLKNGLAEKIGIITINNEPAQICTFKWVYTSFPPTTLLGLTAAEIRRRLGACLACRDIESGFIPYVVIPVPDSGKYHAIGYINEFIRQANEGIIRKIPFIDESLAKYSYAGRSYTPADENARNVEAQKKLIPIIEERYKGKVVVVVDDSIVRGTQTRNDLVPKLTDIGFAEIHLRISNPKLVSTCEWGKSNKRKKNLAAVKENLIDIRTDEEIAEMLGVKSCRFNTVNDLVQVFGTSSESLCADCSKLL